MSNSPLVEYTKISPFKGNSGVPARTMPIDCIAIHCVVGQCSIETLGSIFQQDGTRASSNYGVGPDGRIGMYVEEKDRSWCTSTYEDNRAVTIEVASDTTHPYAVKAAAYSAMLDLVTDICRRNGIEKLVWSDSKQDRVKHKNGCNMMAHRDYEYGKSCPGEYLYSRMQSIADEVNRRLSGGTATPAEPENNAEEMCDVQVRTIGNGDEGNDVVVLQAYLNSIGYNCGAVDGDFGSKTEAALKRYQSNPKRSLTADGVAGPKTWAEILSK